MTGANAAFRGLLRRLDIERDQLPMPPPEEPFHADIEPDRETLAWIRKRAEEYYHGDVNGCVVELLRDARERYEMLAASGWEPTNPPEDLWGPLEARVLPRQYPKPESR